MYNNKNINSILTIQLFRIEMNIRFCTYKIYFCNGCFLETIASVGSPMEKNLASVAKRSKLKVPSSPCTYVSLEWPLIQNLMISYIVAFEAKSYFIRKHKLMYIFSFDGSQFIHA